MARFKFHICLLIYFLVAGYTSSAQKRWHWVQSLKAKGSCYCSASTIDRRGDVVMIGYFKGTACFGKDTLSSISNSFDIFIAKCSNAGVPLWVKSYGTAASDIGRNIAVDDSGNVHGIGDMNGFSKIIVVKLDADGNEVWVNDTLSEVTAQGICIAPFKNGIYIAGKSYLSKLSKEGNEIWKFPNNIDIRAIVADDTGSVYIAGVIESVVSFADTSFSPYGSIWNDGFVARFNPTGTFRWGVQCGGANRDMVTELKLRDSTLYCSGSFEGTGYFGADSLNSVVETSFLSCYTTSGKYVWSKKISEGAPSFVNSITVVNKSLLIAGFFTDSLNLGSQVVRSKGGIDAYAAYLDENGNVLSGITAGGVDDDIAQSAEVDVRGNIILSGYARGNVYFDDNVLPGEGAPFPFVAKFGSYLSSKISIPSITAKAGHEFSLPLIRHIDNPAVIPSLDLIGCIANLRFRASIMSPMDSTQIGTVTNGYHTMSVNAPYLPQKIDNDTLITIPMMALLGDMDLTSIELLDIVWLNSVGDTITEHSTTTQNGSLNITNIWRDGAIPRYVNTTQDSLVLEIVYNSQTEEIIIKAKTSSAPATLQIFTSAGQLVLDLSNQLKVKETVINLPSNTLTKVGYYLCVLRSGNSVVSRIIQ